MGEAMKAGPLCRALCAFAVVATAAAMQSAEVTMLDESDAMSATDAALEKAKTAVMDATAKEMEDKKKLKSAEDATKAAQTDVLAAKRRLLEVKHAEAKKVASAEADYNNKLQRVETETERARKLQQKIGVKLSQDAAKETAIAGQIAKADAEENALIDKANAKLNEAERAQGAAKAADMRNKAAKSAASQLKKAG